MMYLAGGVARYATFVIQDCLEILQREETSRYVTGAPDCRLMIIRSVATVG